MSSRRRAAPLLGFRDATEDWEVLVQRAATTGIPAPRIVQLTGLDPLDVTRALAENPWPLSVLSMQSPPGTRRMCPPLAAAVTRSQRSPHSRRWPARHCCAAFPVNCRRGTPTSSPYGFVCTAECVPFLFEGNGTATNPDWGP
ncbi:DUF6003 family protein [Streptomyces coeruleorubidus]